MECYWLNYWITHWCKVLSFHYIYYILILLSFSCSISKWSPQNVVSKSVLLDKKVEKHCFIWLFHTEPKINNRQNLLCLDYIHAALLNSQQREPPNCHSTSHAITYCEESLYVNRWSPLYNCQIHFTTWHKSHSNTWIWWCIKEIMINKIFCHWQPFTYKFDSWTQELTNTMFTAN